MRSLVVLAVLCGWPALAGAGDQIRPKYLEPAAGLRSYLDGLRRFDVRHALVVRGTWTPPNHALAALHRPLVLSIPRRTLRLRRAVKFAVAPTNVSVTHPFILRAELELLSLDGEHARWKGRYTFLRQSRATGARAKWPKVTELQLTFEAKFSIAEGAIVEASYTYRYATSQAKPEPVSGTLRFATQAELDKPPPQAQIDLGIKRAKERLLDAQADNGALTPASNKHYAIGQHALALTALLVAGVKADDPAITRALTWLRGRRPTSTYDCSAVCMMYRALCKARRGERADRVAGKHVCVLTEAEQRGLRVAAARLVRVQMPSGGWGYAYAAATLKGYDLSNSQYAVLGLRAAARCGVPVKALVWRRTMRHFLAEQQKAGRGQTQRNETRGWYYSPLHVVGRGGTMSMTAAGVASLLIAREQLAALQAWRAEDDTRFRRAVAAGRRWIERHYAKRGIPRWNGSGMTNAYVLYGIERVGVLARVRRLAGRDWYADGARQLLSVQRKDGAIPGSHGGASTPLALLFWKRATMPLGVELTGRDPKKKPAEKPEK